MAFTSVTIIEEYDVSDGSVAEGYVLLYPAVPFRNGTTAVEKRIRLDLDSSGVVSGAAYANTDPTTTPANTYYWVEEHIKGAPVNKYRVVIPHNQGSLVQLRSLVVVEDLPGLTFPIPGPQGPQGEPGPQGPAGADGSGAVDSVNGRTGVVTGLAEAADVTTALAGKLDADPDLTALAGLGDGVPVRSGGTWTAAAPVTRTVSPSATGADIQAALNAAAAQGTGTVTLPSPTGGAYLTNQQIVIPDKVELCGVGREIILRAGPSFPTNTPLVRLGNGSTLVFGSRVRNMTLDCNNVVGSTGVYSTDCNEQSGVFNAVIYNFRSKGIHFEYAGGSTNPSIITIRDCEIYPAAGGATYGIHFNDVAGQNRIADCTFGVNGPLTSAIRITASHTQVHGAHIETSTDGVDFDNSPYGSAIGISGHATVTNLVRIRSNSRGVIAGDLIASGATNLILDDNNSVTIPKTINSRQALSLYNSGETYMGGLKWNPEGGVIASFNGRFIGWRDAYGEVIEGGLVGDAFRRWCIDTDGSLTIGSGSVARDTTLYRGGPNRLRTPGKIVADQGIGVGNSAAATTPGSVTRKIEVFDQTGASIGFIPVYGTIT